MKSFLVFTSFALALLSPFSSALPVLDNHPGIPPFTLRAITPRGATPVINGKLQIVGDAVVVGSAQYATDFTAVRTPPPFYIPPLSGIF